MTVQGSSVGFVKNTLVARLIERPDLQGISVKYEGPRKAIDTRSEDGKLEAIWLGDATSDDEVVVFKAWPLFFEEDYILAAVVQVVHMAVDDGTQRSADERACQLLGALLGELASNPSFATVAEPDFPRCEVTPHGWRHISGRLPTNDGFGSRFEVRLAVAGRVAIT